MQSSPKRDNVFKEDQFPIVTVVIPAYNAQRYIQHVLQGIPAFIAHIIVVDDCSSDNTRAIVADMAQTDSRIKINPHSVNQGVGGAMWSGYQLAHSLDSDVVVKMDSDDQMDPTYLTSLIAPILAGEADYAKGNRFLYSRALRSMPPFRRMGNIGLSFLIKMASGYWNIFDPTNGYTAIHASLVPLLDEMTIDRRYFFESSMLLELGLLGAVVRDVSIPTRYGDETSSLSEWRTFLEFPPRIFRGLARRLWIQYFVRDFNLFSAFAIEGSLLTFFGLTFGLYHWIHNLQLGVATPTGTVMLAVLPVMLGIQFLLQAIVLDVQSVPHRPLHKEESLRHLNTATKRTALPALIFK